MEKVESGKRRLVVEIIALRHWRNMVCRRIQKRLWLRLVCISVFKRVHVNGKLPKPDTAVVHGSVGKQLVVSGYTYGRGTVVP